MDSAGRIVVGGSVHETYGCSHFAAIRLTNAGALDTTFAGTGINIVPFSYDCYNDADGFAVDAFDRIVLAATSQSGATGPTLIRLTEAGALDPTFNATGIVQVPWPSRLIVHAATADRSGAIFVVGATFLAPGGLY